MNKYICLIKEENGFYNIYPKCIVENSIIQDVDITEFPDRGNINIYMNNKNDFQNTYFDYARNLCIVKLDCIKDLEDNVNPRTSSLHITRKKVNGHNLLDNQRIYSINNESIFELIDDFYGVIDVSKVEIKERPMYQTVYIKLDGYIYGPYSYKDNGNKHILEPEDNCIIKKFKMSEGNLKTYKVNLQYNEFVNLIYFDDKKIDFELIDTIKKEALLNKFKAYIATRYNKNDKFTISELNAILKSSDELNLSKDRRKMLEDIFYNYDINEETTEKIAKIISLLIKDINSELTENIIKTILGNNDLVRKLQNVKSVLDFQKTISDDIESKQKKLDELNKEIDDLEQHSTNKENEILRKTNDEINEKMQNLEKLNTEFENISKTLSITFEYDKIVKEVEYTTRKLEELKHETYKKRQEIKEIEKNVSDKLSKAIEQYPDIAFDGMIANKMLAKASEWEKENRTESFNNIVKNINTIPACKFENNDKIKDYIYTNIQKHRPCYNYNQITNFMICLTQGFLTVFAGEPGVGKTSICNIISKVLGLKSFDKKHLINNDMEEGIDCNRYVEVSVERGWTSKRDFIGYYNPLTKTFDKNNSALFSAFNILHLENQNNIKGYPYYILLDEANLSSMEHYWADFMNVCDFDKENRSINIGQDFLFTIPETLRFLATINYDHTTEALSPRLIDRAWVIMLYPNDTDSIRVLDNSIEYDEIICFDDLEKVFSYKYYANELNLDIEKSINDIYSIFQCQKITISPRIKNMIKNYLIVAQHLLTDDENTVKNFIALDYVVSQKLLPKIDGYGEMYRMFLQKINEYCDNNNMMISKKILDKILDNGEKNMHYYHFFV